ncbi:metal ABC transporter solute-binding protein [Aquitalea magnusonii]|uniref:Zinc/manganese transport system substrate-binding protein n=1 Tax=Aquitalea magnusonii TaxID=332411 RepID=A0A318IXD2_9NEIS|nr:metal ABC transporter solute-binding protein [Aquitalea magnusonii]PXX38627.1 zinc/manganese transport system substrate-binding protein [Aquitalea magnusonii]
MNRITRLASLLALACAPLLAQAATQPINIVAGENFYGDVAQQVGGKHVHVTSILSNPDQDPHLFEASASTAKALSAARLVVYNGIDYDPWMAKLLSAAKAAGRKEIVAGQLMQKKTGDNPHLWYDPATMPLVAKAIALELEAADPSNKAEYQQNLKRFLDSLQAINSKVKSIHDKYAGTPVTATEPVFGYMASALGFKMRNEKFQLAVMNNTEPSASDVAAFENDLKTHKVKVLFYNSQASDQSAKRVQKIAKEAKVPVVGVTETAPTGKHYQDWMLGQLNALNQALSSGK